eukprot:57409_1
MPKLLYISGVLFYTFSAFAFLFLGSFLARWCIKDNYKLEAITFYGFITSYSLNWNFVVLILFCRLYYVFSKSPLGLSKLTIVLFIILYILFLSSIFIMCTFMFISTTWFYLFGSLSLLCGVVTSIYITVVFILKLFQVNRQTKDQNDENNAFHLSILGMITKCTILAMFSLFTSILMTFMIPILTKPYFPNLVALYAFFFLDLFSNLACISLSLQYHDKHYKLICGHLDKYLFQCCNNGSFVGPAQTDLASYTSNATSNISSNSTIDIDSKTNTKVENISSNSATHKQSA